MNTTDQHKATCQNCEHDFYFEPILLFGRDIAAGLNRYCESCQERREKELAADDRERAKAEWRETVRRTLPPELLPVHLDPLGTDVRDPSFNLAKWEKVKRWRPNAHGSWCALIGPAGQCKTRILALLAEMILMQGHRLVWTSAMRLHSEATVNMRSRDRMAATIAREHLEECRTVPWLVIDDLGNNEWSPAFESQLFTILDFRKNHRLPIAYSCNAHPDEFSQLITSVNPAALIGRLLDRTTVFDFTPEPQAEMLP